MSYVPSLCDFCFPGEEKEASWFSSDGRGVIYACDEHRSEMDEIMPHYADTFPMAKLTWVNQETEEMEEHG